MDSMVPGLLLPLCDTLTFLSGRGGPAWSLVLGNAGDEMPHPPVGNVWAVGFHSLRLM